MSAAKGIKKQIVRYEKGKPFNMRHVFSFGSRKAVDCALARLVEEGTVTRVSRGIYMRPKSSRFVKSVAPELGEVVKAVAQRTGERVAISGAEAAQRLKLTTQVPVAPMFYTSGSSRELTINNQRVKLKHVADRKLELAGTPAGMALSALWYLGKEAVNEEVLATIANSLSPAVLNEIQAANIPEWMSKAISTYQVMPVAA
jgi:hypothetical protein